MVPVVFSLTASSDVVAVMNNTSLSGPPKQTFCDSFARTNLTNLVTIQIIAVDSVASAGPKIALRVKAKSIGNARIDLGKDTAIG